MGNNMERIMSWKQVFFAWVEASFIVVETGKICVWLWNDDNGRGEEKKRLDGVNYPLGPILPKADIGQTGQRGEYAWQEYTVVAKTTKRFFKKFEENCWQLDLMVIQFIMSTGRTEARHGRPFRLMSEPATVAKKFLLTTWPNGDIFAV